MSAVVHDGVLFGADDVVAAFVGARIPHIGVAGFVGRPFQALGVVLNEHLIGGVVFSNFRGEGGKVFDMEVSIAFDHWRWARCATLARLFAYPFRQIGCPRITALVPADNRRTLKLMRSIGWTEEGRHPRGLDGVTTLVSFGMLPEDCRWLKGSANG